MMRINSVWYYEAKIALGLTSLLPALILPGYALMGLILWTTRGDTPHLQELISVYEIALPLAGGLIAAHLMSTETDNGFHELRRSYPEATWRKPVFRWLGGVLYLLLSVLVSVLLLRLAYGSFDVLYVMGPAFAPALFMLTLALFLNAVSQHYQAVAALVSAYWLMEVLSGGLFTGNLHLFARIQQQFVTSYELNRGLFVVLSALLLLATILWVSWQRQRGGESLWQRMT